jgi:hypothetical protein
MSQNYTYPPGFATATNPSTGTPGNPAPSSATLVAGETTGGILEPISVDTSGNQNTNVVSSVLPTGASTSALQTTGNSSLSTIAANTPPLGQALAGASTPVVLPASQLTTLTPLSTVTANQGTSNATPWNDNIAQYGGTATSLGSKVSASSIPVVIASDQAAITVAQATAANLKVTSFQGTPTALTVFHAALAVGTTAVRLTVAGTAPAATRVALVATPDFASAATFYIGSSTVTNSGATRGIEITAGQSFIANNDAGDYWIVSSIAAQTVTVMEQH